MYTFPRLTFMNVERRTSCRGRRAILTESTSELSAGCLQMLGNLRRAPKMQLFERPFQATKSSPANLFSERSKLKLDLARRLIKPELNVDENNFDETMFIPHSSKSQVKEISTVSKDRNVGKTTKATSKLNGVHVSHGSSIIATMQKEKSITRDRWKILEARQSLKDRNIKDSFRSSTIKKSRIPTERAIISSSVEGTSMSSITKSNIIPRRITISRRGTISVEETTATTIDTTKVRSSMLQSTMVPREETSTLANMIETLDKNNIVTLKLDETSIEIIKSDKQERNNNDIQKETAVTLDNTSVTDALIESMNIYTTEFAHDITLSPTVTTPSSIHSSTTESKKLYPVYIPDAKKYDLSENKSSTKFVSDASKSVFQPRYTKQQEPDKMAISMVTSMTVGPTSRYIRKKSGVFTPYDTVPKPFSTEATCTQMKHREFRPRTATYRRHSEVPTSQLMIQQSTKADKEVAADFITITSKPTKYNAHVVTARNHSDSSEPLVSVKIDTSNDSMPLIFTESSNSNSSASNIFNPTKSAIFSKNTTTLLEQLRSTVAPLLNSLSEKTPIFSGAYSNVNIGNSAPRITPNGSPPRFSARYKGAELFVRKPSIDQVVIPSITTSSTTASTLIENSDLALPVHINSPGEPKFISFYQALESASIKNENLGVNDVSQQQKLTGGVTKVDSNATVSNDISNDTANNNDTASPKSASIATTSFPDITTINITTAVQSANLSFASRLATEIIPDNRPKITSMAIRLPANPGTSGQTTTAPIMKSFGTSASDNTMTNTLASANISNTLMLLNVTTTEIVTIETSTNVDVTSDTLLSTESTSDNVRPFESVDISTKTMEVTSPSTIKAVTDVFTPASVNLQISTNISDTSSPITESVTITQILSEATTMSVMNDTSENIETNTVQQYAETSSQTTKTKDVIENIKMNMIQQFDATIPSQMTENTSTIESTTEEIFNDITEIQGTQAPVTSTFHTRFIDISQNILSHLQDFTVRTSIEKPTTTTTSSKLFNIISDSSSINTKNLEETTTIWETSSRNVGITTIQDVDTELAQTMTNRSAQKMSTQNIVDLATAFSIAHNRSNDQKTNALNMPNSNMTQNARDSSIDAEIATSSRLADFITKNDSRSSNDTLLTKLMTIAKTLFSEEINETRQSLLMSDQIYNFETIVPDINNLTQASSMIENDDKNQLMLSNNMSEKINASAELSTALENTSERIDVITSRNETEESFNRGSTVGSEISLMELNTQPTDITNSIDDTTTTTIAQGTAIGSRIIQSKQPTETTITSILTTSSEFPAIDTTTILSSSIEPMTDTATTTSTSTITTTTLQTTSTKPSSRADLSTTARSMPETTTPAIDINENLISTETTTIDTQSTVVSSIESEELTTTTTITSPVMSMPTATTISPTTQSTTSDRVMSRPPFTSFDVPNMGSYLGSFDGNQATMPASRFSSSSKAPIRDYQVYGIYPNKTIVRKRPEDNLIDARNINSPYVIFGIFPDGRLVRKFPNGTIIPDSPRNPVEVVFTLSTTTTTNRPASRPYYNQVNQAGTYNQYQSPLYYSNPVYYSKPMDKLKGGIQSPSPVDFGFTDNAIGVPSGVGPKFATSFGPPASTPCANKMSNVLLNRNEYTRMNTLPNVASMFGKLQGPIGSSIIGDHENSEASRTKVASNQRNSVYIGQDKFINYQIDSAPDINPKVVDVKINSVATFMNEGVASSMTSIPSFENLLSNQSGGDIVTTPSGFPWRDPLDQIFGITTNSPIQTASVTSNQLNETAENNVPIMARPINPLVEVFTPVISGVTSTNPENKPTTVSISLITTTTPIITTIPITTTTPIIITTPIPTTAATTTTTTTTTAAITTSTTTTAATTTTTTSTTTTPTTTTIGQTTSSTSTIPRLATTTSSLNVNTLSDITLHSNTVPSSPTATISADNILNGLQMNTKENVFGTTFEDLTFLNSLLQNNNVKTTSKTLNDIEQMLANRILALAKPGPTRSPKAIKTISSNSILNAIKDFPSSESSSEPIIIDLLPSSSTLSPGISSSASTTKKYPEVRTTALVQSSTVPITRTKAPVVITAKSKTTIQPKTTTQAPIGFASLWRALFGSNRFEASTIASAKKNPKSVTPRSVQATQKSIEITPKPVQIIKSTTHTSHIMSAIRSHATPRSVDISDIQVISTKSHADNIDSTSASTLSPISTQRTLLNNPNPRLNDVSTSTYSSEDDSKFLVALLRAIQTETKTSTSTMTPKIIEDEEAFLRAILNNQASISTAIPSSTELNPAALLALLLKQQGIEPSTPAIKFREQLQLASLDLTTTRSMTTTTNRATFSSSTQSAVSTRKTTTTPRQSLRSSERTSGYTWSPSSTYPPPLFGENSGSGLITATRAIGQFLGAAIAGAAQQLQSFLRNGTRSIAG